MMANSKEPPFDMPATSSGDTPTGTPSSLSPNAPDSREAAAPDVPSEALDAARRAAAVIWQSAAAQAQARIDEVRHVASSRLSVVQKERDDALTLVARLERRTLDLDSALEDLKTQRDEAWEAAANARAQADAMRRRVEETEADLQQARDEIAALRGRLEAFKGVRVEAPSARETAHMEIRPGSGELGEMLSELRARLEAALSTRAEALLAAREAKSQVRRAREETSELRGRLAKYERPVG